MRLRKLNERGIEKFLEFLHSVPNNPNLSAPRDLLNHSETSIEVEGEEIEIDEKQFGSRYAAAEYLFQKLNRVGISGISEDRGIWSWLALFYFDELCPPKKGGDRKPGQDARWVPEKSARRYYRHLLAGPYRIYKAHSSNPQCASIVLCGPLHEPGEIVENLASRQDLITNAALLSTASNLYIDASTGLPKKGAASRVKIVTGKRRGRPGTVLRMIDVIQQLDVVWDIFAMSPHAIAQILPREFDKFKQKNSS